MRKPGWRTWLLDAVAAALNSSVRETLLRGLDEHDLRGWIDAGELDPVETGEDLALAYGRRRRGGNDRTKQAAMDDSRRGGRPTRSDDPERQMPVETFLGGR
jgi:hypothetical protein